MRNPQMARTLGYCLSLKTYEVIDLRNFMFF